MLGDLTLKPGEQKDLFVAFDPLALSEDTILKGLEKPWGDLYREVVEKRSLEIVDIFLIGWNYSLVRPSNIVSNSTPLIGQILTVSSNNTFDWTTPILPPAALSADLPLSIADGAITLPPADATHDGYLTKEDWIVFSANSAGKRSQKIWQYQDFGAPVLSNLSISAFENGSGLPFDASYIQDGTAQIVLASDTSSPPTTTTFMPGIWFPGNRVTVDSQIGTTVILNQAPANALTCRVFFLVNVPAEIPLPADYQEDPEFTNAASAAFLDTNYVNQNQDEGVFGKKIFESQTRFNASVGIGQDPTTALDVLGTVRTTGLSLTTGAADGYFLKSDASGNASWAQVETAGAAYTTVQEEGSSLTQRTALNFIGSALTASDDGANSRTNIMLAQTPADSTFVVGSGRRIDTILPLTGGGTLASDLSLFLPQATAGQDGYLASVDFSAFAAKLTSPLIAKGDLLTRDASTHVRIAVGADGYVLTADDSQSAGVKWAPPGSEIQTSSVAPTSGQLWIKTPEYELFRFDATRDKWLSSQTIEAGGARNSSAATDIYLRTFDGAPTNEAPFILPFDATLVAISASSADVQSWTAELHADTVLVPGASMAIVAAASGRDNSLNVDFAAGTAIQLFMSGTNIPFPRASFFFARRG